MKFPLSAALVLYLMGSLPTFAAEKSKPGKKKSSTAPSKMIVIPPPTDPAVTGNQPPKLITSEMSGQDLLFFTTVVEAGRLQAILVELLQTKAQSAQIKELAGMLAATQEQENLQVTKLAGAKGWTVSTEPTAIQKAVGADLEKQQGADFDKAVMDKVIAASQQSVSAYETAAQSTDPEIKKFSEVILPLAKQRLLLVQRMTGAGKAANQLLRTGSSPKPVTSPAPSPKATPGTPPPAIIPPKPKSTPVPAATPRSEPQPIPPPKTE